MNNNNNIDRLHLAELYLLVEFDKACRASGLTYFLDSGTALGAVRHGGFIPWDDDIDVGMPREDYEKFMQVGQSLLPKDIFLQNKQTEKNYMRNAAKLRLEGSVFPESYELPLVHNGIYIDIFPFDYLPNNRWLAKINVKYVVEMLHVIRANRGIGRSKSPSKFRRGLDVIIKRMPSRLIDGLEHHILAFARKNQNQETNLMTCYFWRMSQTHEYLFETKKMLPVRDILFEGKKVKIMREPDYYLRLMYNDYMIVPPVEQQKTHCKGDIVFGRFEQSTINE
ncbi:MAG: LicD family protein [Bacteroidaceae bacterium]|nr:LicD family protein [Bacteroidaceae bacterium]